MIFFQKILKLIISPGKTKYIKYSKAQRNIEKINESQNSMEIFLNVLFNITQSSKGLKVLSGALECYLFKFIF